MCSGKSEDIDDWRDLNKLREEVEAQKARVEHLQSEQKWMKNSFSASDLCGKMRLDRSDSGIDRQSLLMESRQNQDGESITNIPNEECSTNSIKKIIEITSLIRAIEQQLNITKSGTDTESMKTYSSTCSMPRCVHEVPESTGVSTSWMHNQLVTACIEQEKLNKQLSHFHNQIFKIENVKMPTLLNGITTDQLKKRIDEYYKLKACLTELATSPTCNSMAMITVVKQLEPIAQGVEHYFRLSQELINIHNQINVIVEKKNSLQRKRSQLLNILQMSNVPKPKSDVLPQSASWNEPRPYTLNPWADATYLPRNHGPYNIPRQDNLRTTENKRSCDEMEEILKGVFWPPFNGDGIAEEDPPVYDEKIINQEKKLKSHNRSLCHQYVNDDVIKERERRTIDQSIELIVSSFPYESITIVQVKRFKLCNPLQFNQQYRARLLQLNGEGSDWNNLCVSDDGTNVFISPHILLPIKWSFNSYTNLTLLLELQMFNKGFESSSNCFMFNILPQKSTQKILVPLHTVQTRITNYEERPSILSVVTNQNRVGSLKLPPRTSTYADIFFQSGRYGMEELSNPMLNRNSPPIHYSNIRRSHTYSHDHQYCGKFECCSSIDFVGEPATTKVNQNYLPQSFRNHKSEAQSKEESGFISSNSSFKRQSTFRQPIRLKRNSKDQEFPSNKHCQTTDHQSSNVMIQELWFVVCDLYLALNSCTTSDERLLQFAHFRTRCPSNLMKLYDYFVETIFDPDHN